MKVAVGSMNPVKIDAVRQAFESLFPDDKWDVEGIDIKSGVSDQPMSDKESIRGARARAKRAIKKLNADYGVGLEGGLQKIGKHWFDCGWIAVIDKHNNEGIGSSMRILMPEKMMQLIFKGKELGEVSDIIFNKTNSKQAEGHFGIMTKNLITRTHGYKDGVIVALSRFVYKDLF